jgi:hypothetical protein
MAEFIMVTGAGTSSVPIEKAFPDKPFRVKSTGRAGKLCGLLVDSCGDGEDAGCRGIASAR